MIRRGALVLAAVLLAAGCGGSAGDADVRVHVDNETDVPIGVYVDGEWRGTDEPGATIVVPLGGGDPPVRIEARSPSGGVLASFEIPAGPVEALRRGSGPAIGEEIGVSCGVIRIVAGELGPDEALAPARAVPPGPCP